MKLSERAETALAEIKKKYPAEKSAVVPALYIAQEELGCLNEEALAWVAERTGVQPAHVRELASFYSMFYSRRLGRYNIQVCRTLPCALRGAEKIVEYLRDRFGLKPGQVSADGMWSYEEVECLGSCGTAPVCRINDHYFENLTPQKLALIIERLTVEKPDLSYSTILDSLGVGLKDYPKSEIV